MYPTSLNTIDGLAIELLALQLLKSPALIKQKQECKALLLADAAATSAEGRETLEQALDDLAYAAALGGVNSDPERPKIAVTLAAAREVQGHRIPGSRYLIDNPDTVYRFVTVDGASRYEIKVRTKHPGPAQYSFMLHDTMFSENSKKSLADQDKPITGLRDIDIKPDSDGSFTVTVDSDPANGRINHLQTNADARIIWIRNSLNDWGTQQPQEVTIQRVGGPQPRPAASQEQMAMQAAAILKGGTEWLLALKNKTFGVVAEANTLSKLFGRGGAWGYVARGTFKLTDDEGLLITLLPPAGGQYFGFQLTDLWQVSREYVHANGSLSNAQAEANRDGSYTYVIAARDPGIHNWVDSSGLHEGGLFIRWQVLPDTPNALEAAVREVKVIKLSALQGLLPAETTRVTPQQRKALYQQRTLNYHQRYTSSDAIDQPLVKRDMSK